jgi:hypothetical protein
MQDVAEVFGGLRSFQRGAGLMAARAILLERVECGESDRVRRNWDFAGLDLLGCSLAIDRSLLGLVTFLRFCLLTFFLRLCFLVGRRGRGFIAFVFLCRCIRLLLPPVGPCETSVCP